MCVLTKKPGKPLDFFLRGREPLHTLTHIANQDNQCWQQWSGGLSKGASVLTLLKSQGNQRSGAEATVGGPLATTGDAQPLGMAGGGGVGAVG